MNSKRIGNIGEAVAIAEFTKLGIPVYLPFGDNERADLIAEFDGKYNAIQVKTAEKTNNGAITFDLTSSTTHRKSGHIHKYTKDEIDYFFCYCIERKASYLIKVGDVPKGHITIRFEKAQNEASKNINYEKDFLFENVMMDKIPLKNIEAIKKIEASKIQKKCPICGKGITRESKLCTECAVKEKTKDNPNKDTLIELILEKSIPDIARKYSVAPTTVRRWLKKYNLPYLVNDIEKYKLNKNKSDE